jgi:hypothetical protein
VQPLCSALRKMAYSVLAQPTGASGFCSRVQQVAVAACCVTAVQVIDRWQASQVDVRISSCALHLEQALQLQVTVL